MAKIQEFALFDGLDVEATKALETLAQRIVLGKGETLFEQGDTARAFYIVVRGGVRLIEHTPEGKDLNLKVYGPGDAFGLLAISGGYIHPAKIAAVNPTVLLSFDGEATRKLIEDHPAVGLCIVDALVDHVHHAHDRIRQMALEKTERRLARALVHFCMKFGQNQDGQQVSANFTQRDIAEFTGTTVETVSRFFSQWEAQGHIKQSRMSVTVISMEGLREIFEAGGERGMGYHLL